MQARTSDIQPGWVLFDRNGEEIGTVEEIGTGYALVQKGLIFTRDIFVPTEQVTEVDTERGHAHVAVDKSEIDDLGWNEPPVMTGTEHVEDDPFANQASWSDTDRSASTATAGDGDTLRVPVREEHLQATKTREQAGEVRVRKDVTEEQRELDIPVTQERVEVRRVATDRPAEAGDEILTDGDTIRVPVTAETVQVTKQPRVVEEVEITKRPETRTERVSETVRREDVEVEEAGNVLAGSASSITGSGTDLDDRVTGTRREGYGDDDLAKSEGEDSLR